MKRFEALQPLSHDHYQGLQMARRLGKELAEGSDSAVLSDAVLGFWQNDLALHFADEELHLLPILDHVAPKMAERVRKEHREIERLATSPGDLPDRIAAFADALAAHIRFEEREVFPTIERGADDETLVSVGEHLHRRQSRPTPESNEM